MDRASVYVCHLTAVAPCFAVVVRVQGVSTLGPNRFISSIDKTIVSQKNGNIDLSSSVSVYHKKTDVLTDA